MRTVQRDECGGARRHGHGACVRRGQCVQRARAGPGPPRGERGRTQRRGPAVAAPARAQHAGPHGGLRARRQQVAVRVRMPVPQQLARRLPVGAHHGAGGGAVHLLLERARVEPVVRLHRNTTQHNAYTMPQLLLSKGPFNWQNGSFKCQVDTIG